MSAPSPEVILGAGPLAAADVVRVARDGVPLRVDDGAWARIEAGRAVVNRAVSRGEPVYGVNTGVGSQKTAAVTAGDIAAFNRRLIAAHGTVSTDDRMSQVEARAALVVQLGIFVSGHAGVSADLVRALVQRLNDPLVTHRAESGTSVGASDLVPLAQLAAPLIGLALPGDAAPAGVPFVLGAKEGLSLMNSNAVSLGRGVLVLEELRAFGAAADLAFALSLEGFRGQLQSVDPWLASLRPHPGQARVLARLQALLEGSALHGAGAARNLQDPLSFRCAPQVHGAFEDTRAWAEDVLARSLRTITDNPAVDTTNDRLVPHGNMDTTLEVVAMDAARAAAAAVLNASMQRIHKLHWPAFSGLPTGLASDEDPTAGVQFLNLPHLAEAHAMEARASATPVLGLYQAQLADGVEDYSAPLPLSVSQTARFLTAAHRALAVEATIAAWAISRRGVSEGDLGAGLRPLFREISAAMPVGSEGHAVFDHRPLAAMVRAHAEAEIARP